MGFRRDTLMRLLLASVIIPLSLALMLDTRVYRRQDSDENSWQKFVRASQTTVIKPKDVVSRQTQGNVSHPNGLVKGDAPTVLTRTQASGKASIIVDFGQNTVGLLSIRFAGASAVTSNRNTLPGLKLAFSETLEFLGDRSDFTRSDHASGDAKLTNGTDQIAVKQQPYEWLAQSGCEHGRQVCGDGLHGFRYVKITLEALDSDSPYTTSYGTVSISSIELHLSAFHGTPDTFTGNFECSDKSITQWWYDAVYTNDLCIDTFRLNDTEPRDAGSPTLVGKLVLHDGAKRDRDPYVGDLAVAALTAYISHDVASSAKNVLADLAAHQRNDGWIPPASIGNYNLQLFDYPLWWVVCSCDYAVYTGDLDYLRSVWPSLVKVLDNFYPSVTNSETNLVERTGYRDYAFIPREGPVTYYNALYVRALKYAADLAEQIGQDQYAPRWRDRATVTGAALLKRNWDSSVGAFFDGGRCGSSQLCPSHSQDGNSLAILSGIANTSTDSGNSRSSVAESILSYLDSSLKRPWGNAFYDNDQVSDGYSQRVYAFISYFEIAARLEVPSTQESAFDEIRRLYGTMSAGDPGVTFWEGIGPGGSPYQGGFTSMSHGWSTGIVPLMTNYVLGITAKKVGFEQWEVKPVVAGELTWARGAMPTPRGAIRVSWTAGQNGAALELDVDAPEGTSGVIGVPVSSKEARVSMGGAVIYDGAAGTAQSGATFKDGRVSVNVGAGKHQLSVAKAA
ncbi:hypothetical protein MCOR27_006593 [Pyricularia oryzae]|uniref:Alpha-L-rhamnosidase n=1 Tax=Pyricularia grisea TaxID=148305 RepID=A0ABQ8NH59_PYRGI|nr:hypothetical protein MCOR01_001567 [Pyricularia oryzae]KAI6297053.1 hypothetical protein MCOR33_006509 [Pyricularia grisea]KAH9429880.1 hypothetical protein MCOR02_009610 [Pyricularia oryzae]KAI6257850.1 hypothetical protein MCOR19_005724 [Pyricularia oryzae]KAI6274824.1 hypothetical protein MCOR26_006279 [Pyricularia oryzae]